MEKHEIQNNLFIWNTTHQTRPFWDFKAPPTKLVRTSLVGDDCTAKLFESESGRWLGWGPVWTMFSAWELFLEVLCEDLGSYFFE